jgi:hypothetical protein
VRKKLVEEQEDTQKVYKGELNCLVGLEKAIGRLLILYRKTKESLDYLKETTDVVQIGCLSSWLIILSLLVY